MPVYAFKKKILKTESQEDKRKKKKDWDQAIPPRYKRFFPICLWL